MCASVLNFWKHFSTYRFWQRCNSIELTNHYERGTNKQPQDQTIATRNSQYSKSFKLNIHEYRLKILPLAIFTSKLTRTVYYILATTSSMEREFIGGRFFMTERRSSIHPKNLNYIPFARLVTRCTIFEILLLIRLCNCFQKNSFFCEKNILCKCYFETNEKWDK